jgi:hypothetical protein
MAMPLVRQTPPRTRDSWPASAEHTRESLVPLPEPLAPLTAVRSTLLLSSVATIQKAGHFERYRQALAPHAQAEVLSAIAGVWLPVRIAVAHYEACDALALSSEQRMSMGRDTGCGLTHHLTRAAALLSRGAGLSPIDVLALFPRFWARTFRGGGLEVVRLGPKDVELTYASCSLLSSMYFRTALRGVALGLLETVSRRCLMRENPGPRISDRARYRLSWV